MSEMNDTGDPWAYSCYMRGFEAGVRWQPIPDHLTSVAENSQAWSDALRDGWNAGVAARLLAVQAAARRFNVEAESPPVDYTPEHQKRGGQ